MAVLLAAAAAAAMALDAVYTRTYASRSCFRGTVLYLRGT
jgi:hypothetical protein